VPGFISNSPLARGLIRIGDEAIVRADNAKLLDQARRNRDGVRRAPGKHRSITGTGPGCGKSLAVSLHGYSPGYLLGQDFMITKRISLHGDKKSSAGTKIKLTGTLALAFHVT
jgi:hypothetical protein